MDYTTRVSVEVKEVFKTDVAVFIRNVRRFCADNFEKNRKEVKKKKEMCIECSIFFSFHSAFDFSCPANNTLQLKGKLGKSN
jgi:hypothetical protein